MAKTVFAVADAGHDTSTAEALGRVKFLYPGKVNVFASDKLIKELHDKLKDSGPEDYLLLSGSAVAMCSVFAILLLKHGQVNVLIWSFRDKKYEVRTISCAQVYKEVAND